MSTTLRTSGGNFNGDLVLPRVIVTDPASVACQTIDDGFALWKGLWFLDGGAGFPWLSYLGQKIVNQNQLVAAIQTFLLSVPGVVGIVSTKAVFNREQRSFTYAFAVTFNTNVVLVGGSGVSTSVQGGS